MDEKLREELARYAHDQAWATWMKYMFNKCFNMDVLSALPSGHLIIPPDLVQRWTRQMNTPFDELPENERKSDFNQADKILEIIRKIAPANQ